MEISSTTCVPPGFRFHPTEEELVGYYLKKKINNINHLQQNLNVIIDIDLCTMEPWDIQGKCSQGASYDEQKEWYFFNHKGKKYPTGSRTNRATAVGFWKATGRDKAVLSKNQVIGMRKTLVFYQGRAPNGKKTDWIIHEYRLQAYEYGPPQEEGWVVCKAFKKTSPNQPSYTRFLYNPKNSHDDQLLPSSMATSSSSLTMQQQELVYDPRSYIYNGHNPVEVIPEIDISDYDHLLAKEDLITELWDSDLIGSFD